MPTSLILVLTTIVAACCAVFFYIKQRTEKEQRHNETRELRKRAYELTILKELGDRAGYLLNIKNVIDIVTASLNEFIEYSVAAYLLRDGDKITFKADLEQSVGKEFISDVKKRMVESLAALTNEDLADAKVEEIVIGSIAASRDTRPHSFFNIPLVLFGEVVGVLTVAHTKEGLYKEDEMTLLYQVVNQATTKLEQLRLAVTSEQSRHEAMLKSMAEGVIITDPNQKVLLINPAARNILGLKENEKDPSIAEISRMFGDTFDIGAKLKESIEKQEVVHDEEVVVNKKIFEASVAPVVSTSKTGVIELIGGIVVLHDITHEAEAQKMRENFTALMVHELRSPLDGIKKMAELMGVDDGIRTKKETFDQYMHLIYESSAEMLDLVNDLLDVSRLEAGKLEIQKASVELRSLLRGALDSFDTKVRDAKINLVFSVADDVPKSILFDQRRIVRAVKALIHNALTRTSPGSSIFVHAFFHKKGRSITDDIQDAGKGAFKSNIHIDPAQPDQVIIAVTDFGPALTGEEKDVLFSKLTMFERGVRSGQSNESGLGLVIAKGIIEAHGEDLYITSGEDGTTFYFTLTI